jgi:phosphoserine phosphatase
MKALGARRDETIAIGDGANDLKMMALAGLSVAFHAKPVVRAQASCAISWCGLDAIVRLYE